MFEQSLNGEWKIELQRKGIALNGKIPGDVHDDLVKSGLIPDPHFDVNARQSYFISSEPITYTKTFVANEKFRCARLCLEGVDGFADVYLNGVRLKRVENAFRRYALPVSNLLARGEQNEIKIVFTPVDEVLGPRVDELAGWKEKRVFMRKPQYNFGWDWALPMPGVGVFGYVKIEYDYEYEIIDYSVKTTLNGRLDFDFEVSPSAYERGYEIKVKVFGHGEDHSFSINRKQHRTYGHVLLKNPKLWWPNGYGEQPLYDYQIELFVDGEKVQKIAGKVGIKQVELLEEPFTKEAGDGYSFWLIVNGERVFIKGGNWIPMELWPGKIDERDYEFQIKMSQFANFNMLRVWGGGIYEKERFYDLCDQYGILVWQDFMFASAGYPATRLRDEIIREANYQIKRLRNRACLALWCGCNEDFNSWEYVCNDADSREMYDETTESVADAQSDTGVYTGSESAKIVRKEEDPFLYSMLLRGLTGKLSPSVPFVESSPMSKDDSGNMMQSGNGHVSCWKYSLVKIFVTHAPFTSWREHFDKVCSFDSEFCDQGPCSTKYLKSFMAEENHWPPNDAWIYHIQRGHQNLPHYEQTLKIVGKEWGEIDSLQKYTKYGRANHLEMMRTEFESARFDYPNNGGTMMWMQNDCWPTANWSIIEYGKNPKPCYYSAKRACEKFLPIIFERKGVIYFAFSNHSFEEGEVQATFGQRTFDKKNITQTTKTMPFKKNETVRFGQINKSDLCENTDYLYLDIVANGEQKSAQVYFPFGWKDLNLPQPSCEASVTKIEEIDGVYRAQISVKANTFVRLFHAFNKDNLNPVFSDNYFDMEKGDEKILYAYFTKKPQISDISFGDFTTEWE